LSVLRERQLLRIVRDQGVQVLIDVGFQTSPIAGRGSLALTLPHRNRREQTPQREHECSAHTEGFYQRSAISMKTTCPRWTKSILVAIFAATFRTCGHRFDERMTTVILRPSKFC